MGWLSLAGGIAKLFNGLLEWMNFRRIKKVGKQEAELENLQRDARQGQAHETRKREVGRLTPAGVARRLREWRKRN